jgi:hypothetical protein
MPSRAQVRADLATMFDDVSRVHGSSQ